MPERESRQSTVRLGDQPGFGLFWAASTVSQFGTYVTTLALQVLIVLTLDGSATDVGLVSSARWLPYLVFGLLSLMNDAAHQSFLPQLVPRSLLTPANARLEQSATAAQASGPVVAGGLVSWLGAPVAVLVDAASYLVSGVLTATIRVADPKPARDGAGPLSLVREAKEGLAWVYGHRMLRPLALNTHGWFLFSSMLGIIYVPFLLLSLGLSAFAVGVTFGLAGLGGLLGSSLSTRIAGRRGISATIAGAAGWPTWAMVGAGQVLFGSVSGLRDRSRCPTASRSLPTGSRAG